MNQNEIITKFREPFSFDSIEWKIQVTTQDKARGMAVPYINSRAIQKRLDDTAGVFGWRNEYRMWHEKSQICGISIFCPERTEWVTKFDGAENSDYEPVKGGLSDAFKRTAVIWGIGRYLYKLEGIWVEIEQKGKSYVIKDNQYETLEVKYNAAVAKIFDTATPLVNTDATPSAAPQSEPPPQTPSQTAPPDNVPTIPEGIYVVHSAKPSGKDSQSVELVDNNGEVTKAFIKTSDKSVKSGIRLKNIIIEEKNSTYGKYNLLSKYELAA